ncbi:L-methionine gamma-lyase-like [Gigantopelta aegis]|uniref:L-methionine gamma-lyase-like n=1 Tax=Gigantopelta aegis TaxID=1735272 RepID=UPI001B889569|nr:L-methionine gamma-lyase-like [Gigantopelta aegis]
MVDARLPAKSDLAKGLHGLSLDDVSMDTRTVSVRYHYEGTPSEPLTPPIYHSSTYKLGHVEDFITVMKEGGSVYSRLSNLTTESAECQINLLEEGAGSIVFASGMAAVSTFLFAFLKTGDHVVCCLPVYSGTQTLLRDVGKFGIEVSWVPAGCSMDEYKKAVKPNTKLLYGETPANPEMSILDLEEFGKLGQSLEGVFTIVDATFASPYLQQPMKYGIDFSLHSCTKYMGGHSDLIGGCITTRTVDQWKKLKKWQTSVGSMLSPHDASLLIRGVKTLPIRMRRHSENAQKVAHHLDQHPKVLRVMYPGLPSHPQHEVARKQMSRGFGGMLMVDVAGGEAGGKIVCESLRIVQLAVSLGGTESIIEHAITMSHGRYLLSEEEIRQNRITPGMLRVSIGLEDPDDLIRDFDQALAKIPA